jgi:hypothetical protein
MPFFLANLLLLVLDLFLWAIIRGGVTACVRARGRSKSYLKKHKKGAANYWLYTALHREGALGCLYYWHYAYLICLGAFAAVTLFSWIPVFRLTVTVFGLLLGAVTVPTYLIAHAYDNLAHTGKIFVVFYTDKDWWSNSGPRYTSSLFDWLWGFLPLAFYLFFLFI